MKKHIKIACHIAPKTCREWVAMHHPIRVDAEHFGGVVGCPSDNIVHTKDLCGGDRNKICDILCRRCWNQPMPEVMA